jgi:serine/threonine protein kinase/Tfp pilus assembly protein PilF
MNPGDRWRKLEELFAAARDLSREDREKLLAGNSLDSNERREVDELLKAHDALEVQGESAFLSSLDSARAALILDVVAATGSETAILSEGDAVGRYRIVRPIGRGGMGVIYLASDPRLNRSVALKLLPAHMNVDSNARRRFEEEARAASRLDHPHIATVYEVDETQDGRLFIAMAYYEGETLRDKLARGPLPIADAVTLATQIAEGLAAAHAVGLVHRDVKPGNIMVTSQNVAKIVDFGIARITTDDAAHDNSTAGTIAYMSPEQTRGEPPTPRMDVWSFGVLLYEMLTAKRPFRSDSDDLVITAIQNDEPDAVRSLRPEAPHALVSIVDRCLRKNPDDRYPDASQLLNDLKKLPGPDAVHPAGRSWRYALAATAVLAMLAVGAAIIRNNETGGDRTARGAHSIAVLPFVSEGSKSEDDHFAAGLADELTTALGEIPGLKVAARTSTVALYGSGLKASAIADSLGVATILEGSVRRDSVRLRISSRLIQARDNTVLWSQAYDVPLRDVFTVQQQIARSIADALDVSLASNASDSAHVARPTADIEAYDLYLHARHVRTRDTRERLEQALAYYGRAIERDPRFADAYSGVAETYVNLANFGYVSAAEGLGNASIASEHALQLNPRLAEAYTSHAYVLTSRREYARAEGEFRRALALNPNLALGRHYYSLLLAMLNRTDEALEQNRLAREVDPLFTPAAADYGIILCQRGELAAADSALSRALTLEPKFALTLYWLGAVRAARGSYSKASELLERAAQISPDYPGVSGSLAYVYSRTSKQREADSIVARLRSRATDDRSRANLAFAYGALGKIDSAFTQLQQLEWDVPSVIGLRADPLLKSLRRDPRYARVISNVVRDSH